MEIEVWQGDIVRADVDVIVTAANHALVGGGGVDGAVHKAAGPELLAALRPLAPCPPGQAVITPAFALGPRVSHVVHAVGPAIGSMSPRRSCSPLPTAPASPVATRSTPTASPSRHCPPGRSGTRCSRPARSAWTPCAAPRPAYVDACSWPSTTGPGSSGSACSSHDVSPPHLNTNIFRGHTLVSSEHPAREARYEAFRALWR